MKRSQKFRNNSHCIICLSRREKKRQQHCFTDLVYSKLYSRLLSRHVRVISRSGTLTRRVGRSLRRTGRSFTRSMIRRGSVRPIVATGSAVGVGGGARGPVMIGRSVKPISATPGPTRPVRHTTITAPPSPVTPTAPELVLLPVLELKINHQ